MRDQFALAASCKKTWDILSERSINRAATRSAASSEITRDEVLFSLGRCDLFNWKEQVPILQNKNGGDLFIYPGFVIYRSSPHLFALIDVAEINLRVTSSRFIEESDSMVPGDSVVSSRVWAKSNKD
jgi:hypothetical protein